MVTQKRQGSTLLSEVLDHEMKAVSYGKPRCLCVFQEPAVASAPSSYRLDICLINIINLLHTLINGVCLRM